MPENDSRVEPPLDAEDWQIAFEVYEGNPSFALTLAHHLISLRSNLIGETQNITEAIAAIDRAVDSLYEHSDFRRVGHELFRAAVEGRLTTDQGHSISACDQLQPTSNYEPHSDRIRRDLAGRESAPRRLFSEVRLQVLARLRSSPKAHVICQ